MTKFSKELIESLTEACEHAEGKPGRVQSSVLETAEGLTGAGVMSKLTMREFDELCRRRGAAADAGGNSRSVRAGRGKPGCLHPLP